MDTLLKTGCRNAYPADGTIGKQRSRKVSWIPSERKPKNFYFSVRILGGVRGRSKLLSLLCQEKVPVAF